MGTAYSKRYFNGNSTQRCKTIGDMSTLNIGEEVTLHALMHFCDYFDCDIADICKVLRNKKEFHCIQMQTDKI